MVMGPPGMLMLPPFPDTPVPGMPLNVNSPVMMVIGMFTAGRGTVLLRVMSARNVIVEDWPVLFALLMAVISSA